MPFRRNVRKRTRPRRRPRRAPRRVPRSIRGRPGGTGQIYNFKRNLSEIVSVGTSGAGWLLNTGSTVMGRTLLHTLNDLTDNSDFKNLFRYYKINAVRMRIWNSNTAVTSNSYTGEFPNAQLLLRYDKNLDGNTTNNLSEQYYLDSQTAKTQNLIKASGKPIDLFYKVKQSNMIYNNSLTAPTAYSLQRPKWVDVESGGNAGHYGLNIMIGRADGAALSTGFVTQQKLRIDYTYYIQCKKVQ